MVSANVTAVFKDITQSCVSKELAVIIVVLRSGCVGSLFLQLHYERRSADQCFLKAEKG